MIRRYRLSAWSAPALDLPAPPDAPGITPLRVPVPGGSVTMYTFAEADFPRIPAVRRWLARPGVDLREEGMRDVEDVRDSPAPLGLLSAPEPEGVEVLRDETVETTRCEVCGLPSYRMASNPTLHIRLGGGAVPGLFSLPKAQPLVMSAQVHAALEKAGLAAGLGVFPVQAEGAAEELLGVHSTAGLGWPAAPYGLTGEPCAGCGRNVIRSPSASDPAPYPGIPRYAFYSVFEHPEQKADWLYWDLQGPTAVVVTAAVRDWLLGPDGSAAELEGEMGYWPFGWYPEEKPVAFLDEALHA